MYAHVTQEGSLSNKRKMMGLEECKNKIFNMRRNIKMQVRLKVECECRQGILMRWKKFTRKEVNKKPEVSREKVA